MSLQPTRVSTRPRLAAGETYLVFARPEKGQPLTQIGLVKAATPGLAFVYARQQYTERHWDELCVVPKRAVFSVAVGSRDRGLPEDSEGVTR